MARKKKSNNNKTLPILKQGSASACAILEYLYFGPQASTCAESIARYHVTDVLSIGSQPLVMVQGVTYHRLPLSDEVSSSIRSVSDRANEIIKDVSERPGRIIFVHCSAAVSRSPTVIVAYLMRHRRMTLYDALAQVIQARPSVCPNAGFLGQLRELEQEIFLTQTLALEELPRKKRDRLVFFGADIQV
ncbi:hypothetical protein H072_3225 [Dactylellina haptotyla CBS 200.50]|uniref:protein-tyrosine-phosphatase n=1 Tax=Dactylellina haptotyla (strain CBS 200.50) TaxID=1284197 RepID=S8ANX9_DACHA|nr:hypothetical protein H072_3225 [Dactylellina haptotyla CBS 200.50]